MINKEILEILVCPACKSKVVLIKNGLICEKCKVKYPIKNDIPIMLINEAEKYPKL